MEIEWYRTDEKISRRLKGSRGHLLPLGGARGRPNLRVDFGVRKQLSWDNDPKAESSLLTEIVMNSEENNFFLFHFVTKMKAPAELAAKSERLWSEAYLLEV